MTTSYYF
jgi:hypothetical protein